VTSTESPTDLTACSATELGALIRAKQASPVEITEAVLARIEAHNGDLHSFLTVTADVARADAAAAEDRAARGELRGPLDGIPISIKDLEPTAGIRTTFGSKFFADNVPAADGVIAERLRGTGAVLLGKTNTPHAGFQDMCDNLLGPAAVNPWDTSRTPGGSSGGAAAAVAAGFGPLAHGSDGAGSIRIPAALCGVVGFKPSWGRVPTAPNAEYWAHRVHNGPLAMTVADAALMLAALSGRDPRDPSSIDQPPLVASLDLPAKPLRAAWSADLGYGIVDPEVAAIAQAAAERFTELGTTVEHRDPPWANPGEWHRVIYTTGLAAALAERVAANPDWIEPTLATMLSVAGGATAVQLRQAEIARGRLYEDAHAFFGEYDLLLTPTMPLTAWSAEPGPGPLEINGQPLPVTLRRSFLVYPFNLTGHPAITVPCGRTKAGLPVGLQIVGRWHADETVLAVAAAFEAAAGPFPRPDLGPADARKGAAE
jgi:Asp-tRNA(Asn)/Glu-tRNA(Gln) amidotransferase A subunit family amidase